MADSVEDDDKWLYSDSSADVTSNAGPKEPVSAERRQSEDLTQIFDNQSSDDFRQLFEDSNPMPEQNSSQPLDQLMDNIKEEKEFGFEGNDKELNETNGSSDEDEDDDDDDVQVTIGDIKANTTAFPYGSTPMNLNITKRSAQFVSGQTTVANKPKAGLDIDAVGTINGVSIYDVNLDSLEEKPWRKPGADITDYFNYGFNEEIWKQYCERQKKLRNNDFGGQPNGAIQANKPPGPSFSGTPQAGAPPGAKPGAEQSIPIASVNENSKYTGIGLTKKAGPPPGRKQSGTIDVIGGGTPTTPSMLPSRRPPDTKENFIQVIGNRPPGPPGPPPPGLPPGMPFPPPGMSMPPPPFFPPPGVEFPPGIPPPPGMPMIAPNGQPIPFPPGDFPPMRFPHPGMLTHPDHHFDDQNDGYHEGMRGSPNEGRDEDRERERERERSERDYHRSSRGYSRDFRDDESYRSSRSAHYREHRDYEHHERSRDREVDKDYESRRHRERDREKDRDKDRDKDRERDRERGESSRRRHRDEHEYEEDHNSRSSSRHKHNKRSKRDNKEEEEKESKH